MARAPRRHVFVWLIAAAFGGTLALGSAGVRAQAPAKRALTIEDYYRIQSVGGPQFSPDGRWILFSVTTRVEAEQATKSESHVVPVDGSAAYYMEDSGTSMAAPHVSGAIAAFLSIRREFIGKPLDVKRIFLSTASPLGRERYFEGHGLIDLIRAIQSI